MRTNHNWFALGKIVTARSHIFLAWFTCLLRISISAYLSHSGIVRGETSIPRSYTDRALQNENSSMTKKLSGQFTSLSSQNQTATYATQEKALYKVYKQYKSSVPAPIVICRKDEFLTKYKNNLSAAFLLFIIVITVWGNSLFAVDFLFAVAKKRGKLNRNAVQ